MCLNPFGSSSPQAPQQAPLAASSVDTATAGAAERERQRRLKARGASSTILSDPLASVAGLPVATKTLLGQ